ncbi:MAG: polysaccharide deacetylase family protein [Candidatus Omnitrophica bacterium]|nr:polysaccharide deacetylase family protein [Candidatus Omnitrophota bacterium]MDD5552403.1 polysaccharide deacetylase family protein [Candidatus Omnitrophota bacterium]
MFKRKILRYTGITVFLLLICAAGFIHSKYVPPILMYHSVDPGAKPQNRLAVTPETFERQMRFLKERRYNVLPLESLASLIKEGRRIPHKTVCITFDDGYKNFYLHAFPILKKYTLPATMFIITGEVERHDRLSWNEIKEMLDSGIISIGSHCLGPEPLVNLKSEDEVRRQIFDSKDLLEARLGRKINLFSHPEGLFNAKIKQLVIDAGYRAAVATNPGKKFADNDIFALKRIRISSNAANLFIFWVESSGYYNFMREHRHK